MASGPSPQSRQDTFSSEVLGELREFLPAAAQKKSTRSAPQLDLSSFESFDQIRSFLCDRSNSGDFGRRVSAAFVEILLSDFNFYDRETKRQISGLLIFLGTHKSPAVAAVVPELVENMGLNSPIVSCLPGLLAYKAGQDLVESSLGSMSNDELKSFATRLCNERAVVAVMQIARTVSPQLLGRFVACLDDSMCAAMVSLATKHSEYRTAMLKICKADASVNGEQRGDRWIKGFLTTISTLQEALIAERAVAAELAADNSELARALAIRARPETDLMLGIVGNEFDEDFLSDADAEIPNYQASPISVIQIEFESCLVESYPPPLAHALFDSVTDWDDLTKN